MKKSLSLLLSVFMAISISAMNYGGTCGDGVTWSFSDDDYILIISYSGSGTGAMTNYFDKTSSPWSNIVNKIDTITIDSGVTTIGDYAFAKCWTTTSVTIPSSVTSIGKDAFYFCRKLPSITIPNSVTTIGMEAFQSCYILASVTIPNGVTTIGDKTFQDCLGLTSVTIPNSVTSIGEKAFYNDTSLTSITCLASTPPVCTSTTFTNVPVSALVNVPSGTASAYQAANYWSGFTNYREKVTIGDAGYTTFCGPNNFTVADATAYKASVNGTTITLTELTGIIPANTGVILKGTSGAEATIAYTTDAATADVNGNDLAGTASETHTVLASEYIYCLTKNTNEFNRVATDVVIPTGKAYFSLAAVPAAPLRIVMPEPVATGVENATMNAASLRMVNGKIVVLRGEKMYDLNGLVKL